METLYSNATGSLTHHADFPSRYVKPRHVDVWCPPALTPALSPWERTAATCYLVLLHARWAKPVHPRAFLRKHGLGCAPALLRLMQTQGLPGAIIIGIWNGGDHIPLEFLLTGHNSSEA